MDLILLIGCALALLFFYSVMSSTICFRQVHLYTEEKTPLRLDLLTLYTVHIGGFKKPLKNMLLTTMSGKVRENPLTGKSTSSITVTMEEYESPTTVSS